MSTSSIFNAQMESPVIVCVSKLLPPDVYEGSGEIVVPEWAFRPDQWSVAFLRGLIKLAPTWSGQRVWEVGVGTGINLIALHDFAPTSEWYFSDLNPRCIPLTFRNLSGLGLKNSRHGGLVGAWDLVDPQSYDRTRPEVEIVFACIPQVPVPSQWDLNAADNFAHYYDPRRYHESRLHACGLGLNEALLARARKVITSRGKVVLNLSGRPGIARLTRLFEDMGYHPRIVHQEVISQHAETSLAPLALLETAGQEPFEFFTDAGAENSITATVAEGRRCVGESVFHKIYVIEGTMM